MVNKLVLTGLAKKTTGAKSLMFLYIYIVCVCILNHGLLNRWTSQLDLGSTTGGLERVFSVHNST